MEEINNRPNLLDAGQGPGKRKRPGWFLYKSSEERAKFDLAHQIPGDEAKPSSDGVIVSTKSDAFPKKILRGVKNIFRSKEAIKIRKNKRKALQVFAEAYSKLKNVYDAIHSIQSGCPTDPEEFSNPGKSSSWQPVNTMSIEELVKMRERIVQLQMKTDKLASNLQIPKIDLGKFAEEQGLLMGHAIDYIDAAERITGIDTYYKTIREGLTTHHRAAGDFITYLKGFEHNNMENITETISMNLDKIRENIQKSVEYQFNEANKPLYNLLMDAIRCCNDNRSKLKSPETTPEQLINWHKQVDQCLRDRQKWENDNLFSQNLKKMEDAVGWMDKIDTGKHETDFREMLTKYKDVFDGSFDLVQIAAGLVTFSDEIHRIAQSELQEVSDNISRIQTDAQLSYRLRNRLEERQVLDSIGEVKYGLTEEEFNELEASIKAIEAIRKGKGKKSGIEDPIQEIFELTESCKERYEKILDEVQNFRKHLRKKLSN